MLGLNNGAQQWVSGDSTDSYVLSMDTVVPVLDLPRINLPTYLPFRPGKATLSAYKICPKFPFWKENVLGLHERGYKHF